MEAGNGSGSGVVKLALEAGDDWRIRNRDYENVHIVGPAVCAVIGGGSLDNCRFEETPEMIFWRTPEHMIIGVIGLENVNFRNCKFDGVAFIGPEAQVQAWRASFGA